jgi:hypothetical protein
MGILACPCIPERPHWAFNDPCDASTPTTIRPLCGGLSAEEGGSEDNRPVLAIRVIMRGRLRHRTDTAVHVPSTRRLAAPAAHQALRQVAERGASDGIQGLRLTSDRTTEPTGGVPRAV